MLKINKKKFKKTVKKKKYIVLKWTMLLFLNTQGYRITALLPNTIAQV